MSSAGSTSLGALSNDGMNRQFRCYKVLVDPLIVGKGAEKVCRYDGKDPPGTRSVAVHDPRTYQFKSNLRDDQLDIPVPRFKYDRHSLGTPAARDVFLSGLNDNSNDKFLRSLCQDFGEIERLRIYRHPTNMKHLGLAKIGYVDTRSARVAAKALNGRSVMGKIIKAILDPKGEESRRAVQAAINPKAEQETTAAAGSSSMSLHATAHSAVSQATSLFPVSSIGTSAGGGVGAPGQAILTGAAGQLLVSASSLVPAARGPGLVPAAAGGAAVVMSTSVAGAPTSFVGGMTMLNVGGQSLMVQASMPVAPSVVGAVAQPAMFSSLVPISSSAALPTVAAANSSSCMRGGGTEHVVKTHGEMTPGHTTAAATPSSGGRRGSGGGGQSPSDRHGHRHRHAATSPKSSSHRPHSGRHGTESSSLSSSYRRHASRSPPSARLPPDHPASRTPERKGGGRARSPLSGSGGSRPSSRCADNRSPDRGHSRERPSSRDHSRSAGGRGHRPADVHRSPTSSSSSSHHHQQQQQRSRSSHRRSPHASSQSAVSGRSRRRSRSSSKNSSSRHEEQAANRTPAAMVEPISPPSPPVSPCAMADVALSQLQQINSLLAEARQSGGGTSTCVSSGATSSGSSGSAGVRVTDLLATAAQPPPASSAAKDSTSISSRTPSSADDKMKYQFLSKGIGRAGGGGGGLADTTTSSPSPPSAAATAHRSSTSKEAVDLHSPALSQSSGYGSGETPGNAADSAPPPPPSAPGQAQPPLPTVQIDDISPPSSPTAPGNGQSLPPLPPSAPVSPVPPPPPPPAGATNNMESDMEMSSDEDSGRSSKRVSPVQSCPMVPPVAPLPLVPPVGIPPPFLPPLLPPGGVPPPPGTFPQMPFPFPGGIPRLPPPVVAKPPVAMVPGPPGVPPPPPGTVPLKPVPPPPLPAAAAVAAAARSAAATASAAVKCQEAVATASPLKSSPSSKSLPVKVPDITSAIMHKLLITSGALVKYMDCVNQEEKALKQYTAHKKSRASSSSSSSVAEAQETRLREILHQGELLHKEQQAILDSLSASLKKRAADHRPLDERVLGRRRGDLVCSKVQASLALELKDVVKKDVRRKLVEGTAFRMLADWQAKKKAEAAGALLGKAGQSSRHAPKPVSSRQSALDAGRPAVATATTTSSASATAVAGSVSLRVRGYHVAVDEHGRVNKPATAPLPKFQKKLGAVSRPLDPRNSLPRQPARPVPVSQTRNSIKQPDGRSKRPGELSREQLRDRGSLSSMVRSARSDTSLERVKSLPCAAEEEESDEESEDDSADEDDEEDGRDRDEVSSPSSAELSSGESSSEEDDEEQSSDDDDDSDASYEPGRKRPRTSSDPLAGAPTPRRASTGSGGGAGVEEKNRFRSQEAHHRQPPTPPPLISDSDLAARAGIALPGGHGGACDLPARGPGTGAGTAGGRDRMATPETPPTDGKETMDGVRLEAVATVTRDGSKASGAGMHAATTGHVHFSTDLFAVANDDMAEKEEADSAAKHRPSSIAHLSSVLLPSAIKAEIPVTPTSEPPSSADIQKTDKKPSLLPADFKSLSDAELLSLGLVAPSRPPRRTSSTRSDEGGLPVSAGVDTEDVFNETAAVDSKPPDGSGVAGEAAVPKSPIPAAEVFKPRSDVDELTLVEECVLSGLDAEDIQYMLQAYSVLQEDEPHLPYTSQPIAFHPATLERERLSAGAGLTPRRRSRLAAEGAASEHKTGCARSEGFYKVAKAKAIRSRSSSQARLIAQFEKPPERPASTLMPATSSRSSGRESRILARRQVAAVGFSDFGATANFHNHLLIRHKRLKFSRSPIHDWGLYAMEFIGSDEMVIEYVGERVRALIADRREHAYEKSGIGSSYLFRVDSECIIDATKTGNVARFVNHSCQPNCYAKIITVGDDKRIVIYSKHEIQVGQEITYDYKFPLEEDKIACLCGAPNCRGYLN